MKPVFSLESEWDLEEIGDVIAQDNPRRAATFIREIRATALGLAQWPDRSPTTPGLDPRIRRAVHGAYYIFYAKVGGRVRILRILHSARLVDPAAIRLEN